MKKRFLFPILLLATAAQAQTVPTFSQDVAPLVYRHCTSCHRTGEVAPFPLTTFAEVSSHGQTIKAVTASRYMPPWKPDPNYRHYLDENTLTPAEIALLRDWVDGGMPQGNPVLAPPVPAYPAGSQLGTPDLVVPMAQKFTHQGNGRDMYRVFVLPINLPADRDVAAVEFRAGNKRIVHHAIIGLDTTGQGAALDAAAPGYGYTQFGGFGFMPVETNFAGWVPGAQARFYPTGLGKRLYRRASLLVQVHYGPTFTTQTDSSVINIFYARSPVTRAVRTVPAISPFALTNGPFTIPAGQVVTFHASQLIPVEASLLSVLPHSHLLARRWKIWAVKPNGDTIRIVKIDDWDFRWQGNYRFPSIVRVPAGSHLEADITYDNTAQNFANPSSPPRTVGWGESTTDEMVLAYFDLVPYRPGDENIVLATAPAAVPAPNARLGLTVFPNPATATTTAVFELPQAGPVSLTVVDETGRLVRTVLSEQPTARGPQQRPVPLQNLPAGLYFLRLEAGGVSQTEKLIVK